MQGFAKRVLAAIERIVKPKRRATSGAPRRPEITPLDPIRSTSTTRRASDRVAEALRAHLSGRSGPPYRTRARERGFRMLSGRSGTPLRSFWFVGGTDPALYARQKRKAGLNELPVNHSPHFAPVLHPTRNGGGGDGRRSAGMERGPMAERSPRRLTGMQADDDREFLADARPDSRSLRHLCLRAQRRDGGDPAASGCVRSSGVVVLAPPAFGGIARDLLIGAVPPAALVDWRYLAVSVAAGLIAFFWSSLSRSSAIRYGPRRHGPGLFASRARRRRLPSGESGDGGTAGNVDRHRWRRRPPRRASRRNSRCAPRPDLYAVAALAGAAIVVGGSMCSIF